MALKLLNLYSTIPNIKTAGFTQILFRAKCIFTPSLKWMLSLQSANSYRYSENFCLDFAQFYRQFCVGKLKRSPLQETVSVLRQILVLLHSQLQQYQNICFWYLLEKLYLKSKIEATLLIDLKILERSHFLRRISWFYKSIKIIQVSRPESVESLENVIFL